MFPNNQPGPAGPKPAGPPGDNHYQPGVPSPATFADKTAAHPLFNEAGGEPGDSPKNSWRSTLTTIGFFLLAPLIAVIIAAFVLQSYQVDGASMENTLQHNDRLIVNKLPRTIARVTGNAYIPKRGEIIIFNEPGNSFGKPKQLIKRVIGLPGERIIVSGDKITVINSQNPEGFDPDAANLYSIDDKQTNGKLDLTLQSDEIFVAGDNRDNSEDSRYFGPVKARDIIGKLAMRILPLNKIDNF